MQISLGAQTKESKIPLRVGYTYNTNPIKQISIFSASATAVIQNAYQFGLI
jgi:long-chain fatty acid transport protein